jgi:hypothetical protein
MTKLKLVSAVLSSLIASVAVAVGDTPATPAAPNAPAAEASIPFADHDGIYNWQVIDDRTVLIQGQNRKWYRASLMSRCFDLAFAERLGFESNPDGSFDKFSSITVRGQSCPLTSLVDAPPPIENQTPVQVRTGGAAGHAYGADTGSRCYALSGLHVDGA